MVEFSSDVQVLGSNLSSPNFFPLINIKDVHQWSYIKRRDTFVCIWLCDLTGVKVSATLNLSACVWRATRERSVTNNIATNIQHDFKNHRFQRQIASYLTKMNVSSALGMSVPRDVLKSGGDNINPGKKWWGHVPPLNYVYAFSTSGGMSLVTLTGQGGNLSPILVIPNHPLQFVLRGRIWVALSQRLCSTLSYKPSHSSSVWGPSPGASRTAFDKLWLGLRRLRDDRRDCCLFVSWCSHPYSVKSRAVEAIWRNDK